MIKSFGCTNTRNLFYGQRVQKFVGIESPARRKLAMLASAHILNDSRCPPGNRLERLKGNRKGKYSIRINGQYRICFRWNDGAEDVEIVDYH